jgi:hypothetical protein
VLAYRPGWQTVEDLNAIARHVRELDPSIRPFIVPTTHRNAITRREIAERPTLVVSPGRMPTFRPLRGKVYQGNAIPKIEEVRRLEKAGVPVPKTEILTPELKLDPAEWGEFVIVKPSDIRTSSHGKGIQLMRTERVQYIAPEDFPRDHPGRLGPMFVQQYVDTGDRLSSYRVLTYLGEPISAVFHAGLDKKVELSESDEVIEAAPIAIQTVGSERDRHLISDKEVLDLARAAYAALPEIPLQGVDLLRDHRTGKFYVIELNSGGNTWHFSSNFYAETRSKTPDFEILRRQQFDYVRTVARVLVERTNAEAA